MEEEIPWSSWYAFEGKKVFKILTVQQQAESAKRVETMLRSECIDLGLSAADAAKPLPGSSIKRYVIPNTVSQAWFIGWAIHRARKSKTDIVRAIVRGGTGHSFQRPH